MWESDDSTPRLGYNAATSTLIVRYVPSPIHQSISIVFTECFVVAKAALSSDLQKQAVLSFEEKMIDSKISTLVLKNDQTSKSRLRGQIVMRQSGFLRLDFWNAMKDSWMMHDSG